MSNGRTVGLRRAAEKWILDRSTLRRIRDRTGTNGHSIHWEQAQEYARHIPSPLEYFEANKIKASGILIIDGTFINVLGEERCVHIAYDTNLGVVDYWIDNSENKTAYSYVFQQLKSAGYVFRCIVSDGHFSIIPTIHEGKYPHQRCIFHILKNFKEFLGDQGGNRVLYSRLKYILKSKTIEELEDRIRWFRKYSEPCFHRKRQKSALNLLWEILPEATIHLCFLDENVPNTSNLLENLNGQIKARLKTFRGVKSEKSLHNLLKILFHFRKHK